jgi:hypothetical protein
MCRHTFQYLKINLPEKYCCSEHLYINIKLILYKALIGSIMVYACATWEYVADAPLLKLQRMQNRVLCPVGNLYKCTQVQKLQVAFKIHYVYDYISNYAGNRQKSSKII